MIRLQYCTLPWEEMNNDLRSTLIKTMSTNNFYYVEAFYKQVLRRCMRTQRVTYGNP